MKPPVIAAALAAFIAIPATAADFATSPDADIVIVPAPVYFCGKFPVSGESHRRQLVALFGEDCGDAYATGGSEPHKVRRTPDKHNPGPSYGGGKPKGYDKHKRDRHDHGKGDHSAGKGKGHH